MTEFSNKVGEIVHKTGAGTNAFRENLSKRIRLALKLIAINSIIFLLSFLTILYSWWSESDAFKTLAGFIFLLSVASVVMGLLSILVTWLSGYAYNKLAEHNKNRDSSNQKELWEKLKKLPGDDRSPFDIPFGPTENCLSSRQMINFVKSGEADADIIQYFKGCKDCREKLERFKKVYS